MPRSVLGIFPHPDDEAYSSGGTLALAARAGAHVHIVTATRGERGEDFREKAQDVRPLAEVRSAELASACHALEIEPPRFLDLKDGGVAGADFPGVVALLVGLIRELRPDVVISLGDDGVYGHPDHIALYRLVVAAVRSAAGGDRFAPEQFGQPHPVPRVLYCAFPRGLFRPQYDRMLGTDQAESMRLADPNRLGVSREEIAVELSIGEVASAKLAAIACHRSQLERGDPRRLFPAGIVDRLLEHESFTSSVSPPAGGPLADLFAGL